MAPKRPREALLDPSSDTAAQPDAKKRKGFRVGPENLPDGAWRRRNTKIKEQLIHKAKVKKAYRKVKAELLQQQETDGSSQQIHPDRLLQIDDEEAATTVRDGADVDDGAPVPGRRGKKPQRQRQPRHPATGANGEVPVAEGTREERRQERLQQEQQQASEEAAKAAAAAATAATSDGDGARERRKPHRRPDYYEKALEEGSKKKAEAEARAAEQKRREEERERKAAEREKIRRAMLKARGVRPGAGRARNQQLQRQQGPRKLGRESHVLLEKVKRLVS